MPGSTYVGETGRTLELRLKEHQRAVKSRHSSNGIAVHTNSTQHSIQWHWDSAEVICREWHIGTRGRYRMRCGSGLTTPWTWIKDCRSTPFGAYYHDTNLHHQPHYIIIITNLYLKCSSLFVLAEEGPRVRNVLWYSLWTNELRSRIAQ